MHVKTAVNVPDVASSAPPFHRGTLADARPAHGTVHDFGRIGVQSRPSTGGGGVVQCQNGGSKKKKKRTTDERVKAARRRYLARRAARRKERYLSNVADAGLEVIDKKATVRGVSTAFGNVNLSKFPTKDPGAKITTVKKEFKGASVGHKYSELADALAPKGTDEKEVAAELLEGIKGTKTKFKHIKTPTQLNAAAKLLAITHSSEPQRVGGTAKLARGGLRMAAKGKATFSQLFKGENPLFPMAKTPKHTRDLLNIEEKKQRTKRKLPTGFDELAEFMSDSSDEEPPVKKAKAVSAATKTVKAVPKKVVKKAPKIPVKKKPLKKTKKKS